MRRGWPVVAALVSVVASLIAAEAALRLLHLEPPGAFSTIRYENDPWALPSQTVMLRSPCFVSDRIHINRFGMRDRERQPARDRPRIALLGDSMTQGLQVADDQTVSRRLEQHWHDRVEVLNFGVSSTGTAVQWLQYRARVRPFHPDTIIVMFFAQNDVEDNLRDLKLRHDPQMGAVSPYLVLDEQGRLLQQPQPGLALRTSPIVTALIGTSLGRWIVHAKRCWSSPAHLAEAGGTPAIAVSDPRDDQLHERAWRVTEQAIARLCADARADGARCGVVLIPSGIEQLETGGPVNAQTQEAADRLRAVADRDNWPLLNLAPAFQQLVRDRGVRQLSYPCDGHWNPAGHAAAADTIAAWLTRLGWVS